MNLYPFFKVFFKYTRKMIYSISWISVLKIIFIRAAIQLFKTKYHFQMEEEKTLLQSQNKEKEDAYRVKKRTVDLLPDADNNISKLQVGAII